MNRFVRCHALTKRGTQCKTRAMALTPFCGIHQGHVHRVEKIQLCFWCDAKVEGEHEYECVSQTRKVLVSFNFIVDMPRSWSPDDIEWHMNCKMNKWDPFEYAMKAMTDLTKNKFIDSSYTEDRDAFVYRYASEVSSKYVNRFGSAVGEE